MERNTSLDLSTSSSRSSKPLALKQRTSSVDVRKDYSEESWKSVLDLLNLREYFITVDHFSIWRRHLAWAKHNGSDLRTYMTARFSSSMVFMSLLLGAELNVLFNSSHVTSKMRQDMQSQNHYTVEFWIGIVIIISVVLTLLTLFSTFTAWGMVSSVSDSNAHCILRSSIGQYVAELPARLIVAAIYSFLLWVTMFLFILLPHFWSFLLLGLVSILFIHTIIVFSAFGRLIMHSGAMDSQRIFDPDFEKGLLPHTLHQNLLGRAKENLEKETSIVRQYRKTARSSSDESDDPIMSDSLRDSTGPDTTETWWRDNQAMRSQDFLQLGDEPTFTHAPFGPRSSSLNSLNDSTNWINNARTTPLPRPPPPGIIDTKKSGNEQHMDKHDGLGDRLSSTASINSVGTAASSSSITSPPTPPTLIIPTLKRDMSPVERQWLLSGSAKNNKNGATASQTLAPGLPFPAPPVVVAAGENPEDNEASSDAGTPTASNKGTKITKPLLQSSTKPVLTRKRTNGDDANNNPTTTPSTSIFHQNTPFPITKLSERSSDDSLSSRDSIVGDENKRNGENTVNTPTNTTNTATTPAAQDGTTSSSSSSSSSSSRLPLLQRQISNSGDALSIPNDMPPPTTTTTIPAITTTNPVGRPRIYSSDSVVVSTTKNGSAIRPGILNRHGSIGRRVAASSSASSSSSMKGRRHHYHRSEGDGIRGFDTFSAAMMMPAGRTSGPLLTKPMGVQRRVSFRHDSVLLPMNEIESALVDDDDDDDAHNNPHNNDNNDDDGRTLSQSSTRRTMMSQDAHKKETFKAISLLEQDEEGVLDLESGSSENIMPQSKRQLLEETIPNNNISPNDNNNNNNNNEQGTMMNNFLASERQHLLSTSIDDDRPNYSSAL